MCLSLSLCKLMAIDEDLGDLQEFALIFTEIF